MDGHSGPVLDYVHNLEEPLGEGLGLCHTDGSSFMSGLAFHVSRKMGVRLLDERTPAREPDRKAKWLRPYQTDAVNTGLIATRGILAAPTGAGKTLYTAGLCYAVPDKWLYLVHRPHLAEQTAKKLREILHEPIGEIRSGVSKLESRIICSNFDSFVSHPSAVEILKQTRGLIVDEVHRAPTSAALKCIVNTPNAYYRLGLSATALLRTDTKDIQTIGMFGPVIHSVSPKELVNDGYLTDLKFHWLPVRLAFEANHGDWQKFYDEAIVDNRERNQAIIDAVVPAAKPAIVFVKKLAHARAMFDALRDKMGADCVELVNGAFSTDERKRIIETTSSGKTKVIVATAVFYEGVDIPAIASIFIAAGMASAIEAIQRIGRGTRLHEGKQVCHIYDVADSGHEWLEKHTRARFNAYRLAGWDVPHPFPAEDTPTPLMSPVTEKTSIWGKIMLAWIVLMIFVGLYNTLTNK